MDAKPVQKKSSQGGCCASKQKPAKAAAVAKGGDAPSPPHGGSTIVDGIEYFEEDRWYRVVGPDGAGESSRGP